MPTTAPHDPSLLDRLAAIPPVGWLVIAAILAVVVRWVQIRIAASQGPDEAAARNKMTDIFLMLRRAAAGSADMIDAPLAAAARANMVLRETDAGTIDPRSVVLHDDRPIRPIAAFPRMILGRLVLLGTGRIVLVTESAFEKLIEADQSLRDRGFDIPPARADEDEHGEKRD